VVGVPSRGGFALDAQIKTVILSSDTTSLAVLRRRANPHSASEGALWVSYLASLAEFRNWLLHNLAKQLFEVRYTSVQSVVYRVSVQHGDFQ
jgi:hypothetical protein